MMYWRNVRGSRFVAGFPEYYRGTDFECFLGFLGVGTFTHKKFVIDIDTGIGTIFMTANENYCNPPVLDRRRFKRLKRRDYQINTGAAK
jgi:hypothetical protein